MTPTVDTTTGEIVEFDPAAAERRAERITLRLDAIAENYRMVLPMIREAIEKRDDIALGYRSPGDYVQDRFGQSLAGLGVDVRRAVVHELTDAGLSTRAIAPVVGTSHMTVQNDIEKSGVNAFTPARPIAPAANSSSTITTTTGTVIAETKHIDIDQTTPTRPVTGIDGKTYTRKQEAPKPRRQPIDALARTAACDIETAIDALAHLAADDRFDPNKDQMAEQLRGHLNRAIETCQGLLDRINS